MSQSVPTHIPPTVSLSVFPNSGHHVQFVALLPKQNELAGQVLQELPDLRERANCLPDGMSNWLAGQCEPRPPAQPQPWRQSGQREWLQFRYGTQERVFAKGGAYTLLGVWVAIESNFGAFGRGYIVDHNPSPTADDQKLFEARCADGLGTVYAATGIDVLPAPDMIEMTTDQGDVVCRLHVTWQRPMAHVPINVDLAIDFGNTRTAVLALEEIAEAGQSLAQVVRPIRFLPRDTVYGGAAGVEFDPSEVLVDSWFVLHQPLMGPSDGVGRRIADFYAVPEEKGWGPFRKKVAKLESVTYRVPHLFVDLSPAILGPCARRALLDVAFATGERVFMSSPKRYAWDTDQLGYRGAQFWGMKLNAWSPPESPALLRGEVLRFMPRDGSDWDITSPPTTWPPEQRPVPNPGEPDYPHSDALTWVALSIIETAYRQITSEAWRKGRQPDVPRQIKNIYVTFPSGWTRSELDAYRAKWQKAVNIFTLAHLRDTQPASKGGGAPELVMSMDEAVASQLPVVFSEIHRLGDVGENWLEMIGRGRGTEARARVMTIDIGGGTTDTSIVEYHDRMPEAGVNLLATLLFKDSTTIAGDWLVKNIIESVLLPTLGSRLPREGGLRQRFERFFADALPTLAAKHSAARMTRVLFVPVVHRWLQDLIDGREGDPQATDGLHAWNLGRLISDKESELLTDLNLRLAQEGIIGEGSELIGMTTPLRPEPSYDAVRGCIRECFETLFASLAKYAAAFECDLAVVTGKPSELPPLRRLLEEHLPLLPCRIISAKDYPAGDWWPLSSDGRVNDAKLVTAVGGVLFQAIQNHQIDHWNIERRSSPELLTSNWWGAMPMPNNPTRFGSVYLEPDQDERTCQIQINTQIGRKLLRSAAKPEPVYLLRWKDRQRRGGAQQLAVRLRRRPPVEAEEGDALEIVEVQGTFDNLPVVLSDVELKLCSLPRGEEFWLDTGRFEIRWPGGAGQ